MLHIDLKIKKNNLRAFERNYINILEDIRKDLRRLGNACYKECLKRIIPVSHRRRPHLRNSFMIDSFLYSRNSVLLRIFSKLWYAFFADVDANIPTRYPKHRKVMKWTTPTGEVVYAKKAKGFYKRGLYFTYFAEIWLTEHFDRYVDMTLNRYLSKYLRK